MLATALHRFLTIAIAISIGIAALAFSVVVFAAIAAVGALTLAYAWWRQKFGRPRVAPQARTRAHSRAPSRVRGEIIDLPSREVDRE